MTLIGWVYTIVVACFIGGLITLLIGCLIEKLVYNDDSDANDGKDTKKVDIILLIVFILLIIFITYLMYVGEVSNKYEMLESATSDYNLYIYSLQDEKLSSEIKYELINDVQMYNRKIISYKSVGRNIIGHQDLKSQYAALKLINLE